jgi:hypothetical protein
MRSRWRSRVVFGLVGVYLLIALPVGLRNTALRMRAAARTAGLSAGDMRMRIFGPQYVAAIEQIRRVIPEDEPYLLGEMDEPGAILWVRFDLLPRRAILDAASPPSSPDCWRDQVRWLVVATGSRQPPLFFEHPTRIPPGCPPVPWRSPAR